MPHAGNRARPGNRSATTLYSAALFTGLIPTMMLAAPARATVVEPGGVVNDFDTTVADRPDLSGTVVASKTVALSFGQTNTFSSSLLEQVVRDPSTGALSFQYRFDNTSNAIVG